MNLLQEGISLLEKFLGLSRKPHHNVYSYEHSIAQFLSQRIYFVFEEFGGIVPSHSLQNLVAAHLKRDMKMRLNLTSACYPVDYLVA